MDGQTSRQTDRLDVGKQDDKPNESMIIGFVDNWRVELFPLGVFVRWFSLRHSSLEGSAHARDDISRCFHDLYVRTRANLRTRMRMTRRNAIYFLVSLNKKKKKQPRETGNERVAQRRVKKKNFPRRRDDRTFQARIGSSCANADQGVVFFEKFSSDFYFARFRMAWADKFLRGFFADDDSFISELSRCRTNLLSLIFSPSYRFFNFFFSFYLLFFLQLL